jgi:hypothetical protein
MTVTQLPFEWHRPRHVQEESEVALETHAIETVVPLMASAMIAVVSVAEPSQEVDDER